MVGNTERKFWAAEELAVRWGIIGSTVREMIRRGDLAAMKIGTIWRVADTEVQRYEAQGGLNGGVAHA
jgi:excisionase family DNA binding protein